MTVALVPELDDQDATADLTAFVSASPLEPMSTVRGSFDEVSLLVEPLPPLPVSLLLPNPEPQPARASAAEAATAPMSTVRVSDLDM
jgi:hypothetical protein